MLSSLDEWESFPDDYVMCLMEAISWKELIINEHLLNMQMHKTGKTLCQRL